MKDLFAINAPVTIDQLSLGNHTIGLLRLDRIHPEISGNKWFKLKYNISKAIDRGKKGILTFGGAYSNHIAASAAAARMAGILSVGIIRGEETSMSNPTLTRALKNGMKFIFISRKDYREKASQNWEDLYSDYLIVPEGGSNKEGVSGAIEISRFIPEEYATVALAVGTGGTMAGIISSGINSEILGFPVVKNSEYLEGEIKNAILNTASASTYSFCHGYHFGGYAKMKPELISFIADFYNKTGIRLDPVYTAKLLFGLKSELNEQGVKGPVLAIHTGGLQGIEGMEKRLGTHFFNQTDH